MGDTLPKVGLICSHGGHLAEMNGLIDAFEGCDRFYFSYDAETTRALENVYLTPNKPYSLIQFAKNLIRFWGIISKERPDWLVSTGAEIALPGFLVAKLRGVRTIYVESVAQITRPSVTGRIMVHLADHFYVQWPELQEYYGEKALFVGSLFDSIEEPAE